MIKFILSLILLVATYPCFAQDKFNLADRLQTQRYMSKWSKAFDLPTSFEKEYAKLSKQNQLRLLTLSEELELILPEKVLESYLYWRLIANNDKKAQDVLSYALLYRLLLIRDTIEDPRGSKENQVQARERLKEISDVPEITIHNICHHMCQFLEHKSQTLHAIKNSSVFVKGIQKSPILSRPLQFKNPHTTLLSFLGHIPTTGISLLETQNLEGQIEAILQDSEEFLFIEASIFQTLSQVDVKNILKKMIQENGTKVTLYFALPEQNESYQEWLEFSKENSLSSDQLTLIKGHLETSPIVQKDSYEAAPLFPLEVDAISSLGGLIAIDPHLKKSKAILLGPHHNRSLFAFGLAGAAASALVYGLGLDEIPFKMHDELFEVDDNDQFVQLARLIPSENITELRPQIVSMIKNAKSNIHIHQFFFFDSRIVDALIKRKIQMPQLEVKVLQDHNIDYEMGGFPNSIFLEELISKGIKIRSLKTDPSYKPFISVDSEVALVGTQNLIPTQLGKDSMIQAFKLYDPAAISALHERFESQWSDTSQVYALNPKQFRFHGQDQFFSRNFSKLLNAISAQFLRWQD